MTARLWRLDAEFGDALTAELADAQLLIADGHHRYETALAFHERGRHRGERVDDGRASSRPTRRD